jgi:UDP-N-acetylglucosamine 2-epimerase (non-hydrolysing)
MSGTRRIMVLYGTRPEAIKVAPLVSRLEASDIFEVVPVVTGQHREMLDQVNQLFGIVPKHDFDLMVHGAGLDALAARALTAASECIRAESPDAIVVQGDTTTAFISALAAFYAGVPVVHLEAGLRSFDIDSPFPEEGNRQLTARVSRLHLAPTSVSRDNLLAEGVAADAVAVTGNTVIDALRDALRRPLASHDGVVARATARPGRMVLVTAHRRESWGEPMRRAMEGVRRVAREHPDVHWLVPMHRNPVVRDVLRECLGDLASVTLTEPLDYHEFCHAMAAAHLVLTDSGGVQEEAPSLGKPVLVMRDNTERPEAVDAGTVELVGTGTDAVASALAELLTSDARYDEMAQAVNPYGDGFASHRAVNAIGALFGLAERSPDFDPDHPRTHP